MDSLLPFVGKYVILPYILWRTYGYVSLRLAMSRQDLKGKVVLITGASSGLGEELAYVLSEAGCKLILAARRLEELERVRDVIVKAGREAPHVLRLDLGDTENIPKVAESALRIHGQIDILINNGGISSRGSVEETTMAVHQNLMNINYFGTITLTKALLPSMIEKKTGHIVVVSSLQGKLAIPNRSAYAASKHALQAFFDSLRTEIAEYNIPVCVLSPGYIRTQLSMNALSRDGSKHGQMDANTASGVDPHDAALDIYASILRKDNEVIMAPLLFRAMIIVRAILPDLYFTIMKHREQRDKNKSK